MFTEEDSSSGRWEELRKKLQKREDVEENVFSAIWKDERK